MEDLLIVEESYLEAFLELEASYLFHSVPSAFVEVQDFEV
jgi:hypothetical protein